MSKIKIFTFGFSSLRKVRLVDHIDKHTHTHIHSHKWGTRRSLMSISLAAHCTQTSRSREHVYLHVRVENLSGHSQTMLFSCPLTQLLVNG